MLLVSAGILGLIFVPADDEARLNFETFTPFNRFFDWCRVEQLNANVVAMLVDLSGQFRVVLALIGKLVDVDAALAPRDQQVTLIVEVGVFYQGQLWHIHGLAMLVPDDVVNLIHENELEIARHQKEDLQPIAVGLLNKHLLGV